jgi:uncharacterized protein (DUF1697 family)
MSPSIFIALLRGVNVGGSRCKMLLLRDLVMKINPVADVQTYLQSGNIVLTLKGREEGVEVSIPALEDQIGLTIKQNCGFEPAVFIMTLDEYSSILLTNPYVKEANEDMKTVHLFVFPRHYKVDSSALLAADKLKSASEKLTFINRTLFLHTPEGFGISKLAKNIEKVFGCAATARNWRSTVSIQALAETTRTSQSESATSSGGVGECVTVTVHDSSGGSGDLRCKVRSVNPRDNHHFSEPTGPPPPAAAAATEGAGAGTKKRKITRQEVDEHYASECARKDAHIKNVKIARKKRS